MNRKINFPAYINVCGHRVRVSSINQKKYWLYCHYFHLILSECERMHTRIPGDNNENSSWKNENSENHPTNCIANLNAIGAVPVLSYQEFLHLVAPRKYLNGVNSPNTKKKTAVEEEVNMNAKMGEDNVNEAQLNTISGTL